MRFADRKFLAVSTLTSAIITLALTLTGCTKSKDEQAGRANDESSSVMDSGRASRTDDAPNNSLQPGTAASSTPQPGARGDLNQPGVSGLGAGSDATGPTGGNPNVTGGGNDSDGSSR